MSNLKIPNKNQLAIIITDEKLISLAYYNCWSSAPWFSKERKATHEAKKQECWDMFFEIHPDVSSGTLSAGGNRWGVNTKYYVIINEEVNDDN